MAIAKKDINYIFAKCARHCCICRRFQPNHLQVHHIVERSEGGSDEVDNLIATCISCHASIHATTGMTRVFTADELKQHRDNVYTLVSEGRIPANEVDSLTVSRLAESVVKQIKDAKHIPDIQNEPVARESLNLLIAAVTEGSSIQIVRQETWVRYHIGNQVFHFHDLADSELPRNAQELADTKLVRFRGDTGHVTSNGLDLANEILTTEATFTLKKIKCMQCSLHFMLCTWHPKRHNKSNIHCPECGQADGNFIVWAQKEAGHIFEHVPGSAMIV